MTEFADLSREERALYNPAFTGLVVARAVQGHEDRYASPCPVVVAVVSAVMALQPAIRRALPRSTGSGLMLWLEEHKDVAVAMSRNATALSAVVRPGLLFALQSQSLHCDASGNLSTVPRAVSKKIANSGAESAAVQRASHLLGRWLPSTGSLSTVLTLLGVRP